MGPRKGLLPWHANIEDDEIDAIALGDQATKRGGAVSLTYPEAVQTQVFGNRGPNIGLVVDSYDVRYPRHTPAAAPPPL